jgi:ATP-binding protein involved in chromosome partitioning
MKGYHDIRGDGGSDIVGQVAAKRERIAARLAGVRRMVAIGSGKGGVGKSTLTAGLACALRAGGASVAVLDADLNGPTQARIGGIADVPLIPGSGGLIMPRTRSGIGVVSMGLLVPEPRPLEFASVADGDSYVWRATREFALLGDLLAAVDWGVVDFLLVDLPPGAERTVQYAEFLGSATALVLVTLPSDVSRGIVARSIAALGAAANRVLGYAENMKGYACAGCGTIRPLFAESGAIDLGVPCLGAVPFDPDLAAACDRGEPLPSGVSTPTGVAIRALAGEIRSRLEAS